MSKFLKIENLSAFYGSFQAIFSISLEMDAQKIIAIIGANGSGKSTFMRCLMNVHEKFNGKVEFKGQELQSLKNSEIVGMGIALVPEGRKLFPSLSIEENLLLGCYARKKKGYWDLKRIYELFPILEKYKKKFPRTLSGGQQQMVAIGRALMSNPELLLCDEISLGLAPIVIKDIYKALQKVKSLGTSILLVEQDTNQALAVCDKFYCFMEGRVSLEAEPKKVTAKQIHSAYFGIK